MNIWTTLLQPPRFHPFLWQKIWPFPGDLRGKKAGPRLVPELPGRRLRGGAAWPWYPAAGRRALSQLSLNGGRFNGGRYMGMMTIYDNLVIFYRDFFRLLRWFFEQSWDLKEILNPGSNFHYRMVGLRSTQSCQSGYFIRNFGVGARYFVARGFRSHIMGRLGSSTAFCSDHVVDSDHDQSTKCSCKKSLLDDLRFCGAKSLLQNAPSKNWTLRASYETLFRIPPFL